MGLEYDSDSDGESPKIFHSETLKAKINHRCAECRGIIESGQYYERNTGIWDVRWETFRKCQFCLAFEQAFDAHYRGFARSSSFGCMISDAQQSLMDLYSPVEHPGRWYGVAKKLVQIRKNYDSQMSRQVVDKSGRGNKPGTHIWYRRRDEIKLINDRKKDETRI